VRQIDSAHFRKVLGNFPTGVTVITTANGSSQLLGFAVGSFFSVSLDPPLIGFCAAKSSSSWPVIRDSGAFCVNVLADDQEALCRQFSSKGEDRFVGVDWEPGATGAPRITSALCWIDCRIEAVHDAGDHEICIGRVWDLDHQRDGGPLLFFRSAYGRLAP
jgi:3-hydroxy-9,10-secoandrosta-1,3,5(10)-triene-9,17-dione monooxygenase reductase component